MLTRLRVQGFKNLLDVDIPLGPLTCVAGPNGVGKSNLFDAIHFLHLLTQYPIMGAAERLRDTTGRALEPASLFTRFGDHSVPLLRFTAEMIVDRHAKDAFGVEAEASISSVRYTVGFSLSDDDGPRRLILVEERLEPIPITEARKKIGFTRKTEFLRSCIEGRRSQANPFISTHRQDGPEPEIQVHQEGHGGRKLPAPKSLQTVVGGMATSEYPTILAVHREMASWRTLMLEPSAMRASSAYRDPRHIDAHGANLPATIDRLCKTAAKTGGSAEQVRAILANRLAELLDDVRDVRIRDDAANETLILEVAGRDGVYHPARSLSDGTLRFLVLAALLEDGEERGLLCLEEPENGLHPRRVPAMVRLLKDIAVDPELPVAKDNPLRQVIVNTHAPLVENEMEPGDLVYLENVQGEHEIAGTTVHGWTSEISLQEESWRMKALAPGKPRIVAPGKTLSFPAVQRQMQMFSEFNAE